MKAKINILNHEFEARAMRKFTHPTELVEAHGIPPTLDIYTAFSDPEDERFTALICFPPVVVGVSVDGILLIDRSTGRAYYNPFASSQYLAPGDSLNGSIIRPVTPVELDTGAC